MAFQLLPPLIATILIFISFLVAHHRRTLQSLRNTNKPTLMSSLPEPTKVSRSLASALPNSVILPRDTVAFNRSMNSYWAQQECEVIPACVVRPSDVQQLSTAVTVLKHEYDEREKQAGQTKAEGLFAVRSGGHSPVSGAASVNGGVLVDLSLFREVTPSKDTSNVAIGAGAKWMDVSKVLDKNGLAVVGGRNSAVGVGGLSLGGTFLPFIVSYILPTASIENRTQQVRDLTVLELIQMQG